MVVIVLLLGVPVPLSFLVVLTVVAVLTVAAVVAVGVLYSMETDGPLIFFNASLIFPVPAPLLFFAAVVKVEYNFVADHDDGNGNIDVDLLMDDDSDTNAGCCMNAITGTTLFELLVVQMKMATQTTRRDTVTFLLKLKPILFNADAA